VGPVDTGNGITVAVLRITTGPVFEAPAGVLIACFTGAEGSEISPAAVETADGSAVSVCRSLEIILKGQRQTYHGDGSKSGGHSHRNWDTSPCTRLSSDSRNSRRSRTPRAATSCSRRRKHSHISR
jgi:hypothetical protein